MDFDRSRTATAATTSPPPLTASANVTYLITTTLGAGTTAYGGGAVPYGGQVPPGVVILANPTSLATVEISADFTIFNIVGDPSNGQTVFASVTAPADPVPSHTPTGSVVLWVTPGFTSSIVLSFPLSTGGASFAPSLSTTAGITSSPTTTVSSTQSEQNPTQSAQSSVSAGTSSRPSYSKATLAGVAVGCAFAGIICTAILFFLCLRKKTARKRNPSERADRESTPLRDHGEVVYIADKPRKGWESSLPQADSDSSIQTMINRTLDQISLHVENFYTYRPNVRLDTEREFRLEAVESARLSESISVMLQRTSQVEDLIKHYMSSYIISMIGFEDSDATGTFLPKVFRRQWQPSSRDIVAEGAGQAYSRWRVLTAYLRQSSGDEQRYLAERDAAIDTAAKQLCAAFEPWVKNREDDRVKNMVGIMRHASELGILLFSQPARFVWQWHAPKSPTRAMTANAPASVVVLPGLYKTTDQNAVPLRTPLRLVEPVTITIGGL